MKRLTLILLIVTGGIAWWPSHGVAASPGRSWNAVMHHLGRSIWAKPLRPREHANRDTTAPSRQTGSAFRLDASAFSPYPLNTQYDRVESNTQADGDWFASLHTLTYGSFGRISGYYQRADDGVEFIRYQASIYPAGATGNADAVAAKRNAVDNIAVNILVPPTDCTAAVNADCQIYNFLLGGQEVLYVAVVYQNCLIEASAEGVQAVFDADISRVNSALTNVITAGASKMRANCGVSAATSTPLPAATQPPPNTPVPATPIPPTATPAPRPTATTFVPRTPTVFSLLAVRFEKKGAKPDYHLTHSALSKLKSGGKAVLAAYVKVDSGPPNSVLGGHVLIQRFGKTILNRTLASHTLPTNPADEYRDFVTITFSGTGTYVATFDITINGQSKRGTTALLVTKKHL